mmetsp:Transcript_14350/g.18209  ORF Transcript_14350/g.18209 Transcript_14350/m.18209 type:complete len:505 (-) Transcript_14350:42-1556(-)
MKSTASYWLQQCKTPLQPSNALSGLVDVAVIGAGIFGTSTALRLAEEGKSVVLVEANKVGQGVSGYSTCKVTSLHRLSYDNITQKYGSDAARTFGHINEAAIRDIDQNVSRFNIDCDYSRRDAVTFTLEKSMVSDIEKEVKAAKKSGLEAEFVTELDLPFPVEAAIKVSNQAQFNAYAYCIGITNEFIKKGGIVYEDIRVTNVSSLSSPHTVETSKGPIKAENVVLATHMPILDRGGHFAVCSPTASYCIAYKVKEGASIPKGMYITAEMERTRSIRTLENDTILLVGGNSHPLGEPHDGNTEHEYEELDAWARKNLPVSEMISHWSSEDYRVPDLLPYVGYLHHGTSSLFTATGFKKWGFTTGVAASKIVTDLIMSRDSVGHSLLDARRLNVTKSATSILKTQGKVAKHFVKDRTEHLVKPTDIEDLANGCGAVCKYKGKTVAAYKDDSGSIHAVSPVCTHLGCHIVWNQGDRIWDCPCHGSRFDIMGKVLHGPAVKDLQRYE